MKIVRILLAILAVMALAGCGPRPATPVNSTSQPPAPLLPVVGTEPPSGQPPELTPPPQTGSSLDSLQASAMQDLAQRQSTRLEDIKVIETREETWPDTSLGCPQPDMMYAQMVTPGYVIVLSSPGGQFEYHTDRNMTVVQCAHPVPTPAGMDALVKAAMQDLAMRLSVRLDQITLVEASQVTWPDASLGCPRPGMMYAQVLIPGFRIVLKVGDQLYEYHSGRGGELTTCKEPIPSGGMKP
ncbi:MAG TPA: hypothetical protein VGK00_17955 [Anaerolineales bacterium]|jgi:hypothetical protein